MAIDQVEEVKLKTDIVTVIGEHIELKKAGRNFRANCPFHGERTPSFMVSQELQIFKCFGCGESGDVFAFMQKYEGMEFYEALKYLADKAGVELVSSNPQASGEKEKIIKLNKLALRFYNYMLLTHSSGKRALAYLTQERGIKMDTIKRFELGFSPDAPGALSGFLVEKKGYKAADLTRAGMVYYRGSAVWDRFAGRVIFPLFDHRGNNVGFGGRILPGPKEKDSAKYINTPETPVYHKSGNLYGLHIAKDDIKKMKEAVVVEGELDAISSWQAGVKNVVAIKGTALTQEQVKLITRFAPKITMALDSDFAGDAAARRGVVLAQDQGLEVKVAPLGEYKDPDEMARQSPVAYQATLKNAVGVWDFFINSAIKRYDITTGEGKAKVSREIIPVLSMIGDKIVQAHYAQQVAKTLSVPVSAVLEQLSGYKSTEKRKTELVSVKPNREKSRRQILEERLLSMIFQTKPSELKNEKITALFKTPLCTKLLEQFNSHYKLEAKYDAAQFGVKLPAELLDGYAEMIMADMQQTEYPDRAEKEIALLVKELKLLEIKTSLTQTAEKIGNLEKQKDGDKDKLAKMKNKFTQLAKKLSELEEDQNQGIIH